MIFDTNIVLYHIRARRPLPTDAIISSIVAGELYSIALQNGWGANRISYLDLIIDAQPKITVDFDIIGIYSEIDTYSKGKLQRLPLVDPQTGQRTGPRNMGKNDLWIAAMAVFLKEELHTADKDFDHLPAYGLNLVRYNADNPFNENP